MVHDVYRIEDSAAIDHAARLVRPLARLYIADGHHRAAAAKNVALARGGGGRAGVEAGRFLAVLFPHDQVEIHGYSRLVADLAGMTREGFLGRVSRDFNLRRIPPADRAEILAPGGGSGVVRLFRMYIGGEWYELRRPREPPAPGGVPLLDVQVLQDRLLGPLLGIRAPRDDPRLQFLGGSRPAAHLEERVDSGEFAVAFALQPVRIDEVMAVADAGGIMPPKSTWFEPKLRDGLLNHII
jgi:uncharacterized protein (DUF1015 family)